MKRIIFISSLLAILVINIFGLGNFRTVNNIQELVSTNNNPQNILTNYIAVDSGRLYSWNSASTTATNTESVFESLYLKNIVGTNVGRFLQFGITDSELVWTNETSGSINVIHPKVSQNYSYIYYSNSVSQGTESVLSKSQLLTLGTNVLTSGEHSQFILLSPTNDYTQVILSLNAGTTTVQRLEIFNYTNVSHPGAFILPANSAIANSSGLVKLKNDKDWISTNGVGIQLRFMSPNWVELDREDINAPTFRVAINPTDNFIPIRVNSTTFDDSYLVKSGANLMFFTNSGLKIDNNLVVNPRFQANKSAIVYGSESSLSTAIEGDHVTIIQQHENHIGANDKYNSEGLTVYGFGGGTHATTPVNWSPNIDWIGSAYSTNANMTYEVGFGSQLHTYGAADIPNGILYFVSHIGLVGSLSLTTNFSLMTASGWTGNGSKVYTDGGYFTNITSVGSVINPTDSYLPYRTSATTFGNSPFFVIATNSIAFNGSPFIVSDYPLTGFNIGTGNTAKPALVSVGPLAGGGNLSTALGYNAMNNSTAVGSVGIGYDALANNNNTHNVGVGMEAGNNGGSLLVAIGFDAGWKNTNGTQNTIVGALVNASSSGATNGNNNVYLGYSAGFGQSGSSNIVIGANAQTGTSGVGNIIGIGYGVVITNANEIVIGNQNHTKIFIPQPVIPIYTPSSSSETNYAGAICWDASYLYVWTAANVNKRVALTAW